ncbi:unnamed protein product [Somion occarium]|uniref:F-box domain-containing protein n=1 Tax=Somion occarium TaxID=3059160 RepID=A0ABP1E4Z1_9APHY
MQSAPQEGLEEQLARFRDQWKAELQRARERRETGHSSTVLHAPVTNQPAPSVPRVKEVIEIVPVPVAQPVSAITPSTRARVPQQRTSANAPLELTPKQREAADVYHQAIALEQSGDHTGATVLYRKAFRMHDHVDYVYRTLEAQQEAIVSTSPTTHERIHPKKHVNVHAPTTAVPHRPDVHHLIEGIKGMEVSSTHARSRKTQIVSLTPIIAQWPAELEFRPEDEDEPIPIANVPDEVLLYIMHMLDVTSLERFASVSRKARVVTLDSGLWRTFVETLYIPPQVSYDEEINDLVDNYMNDYRRIYIEHPRVRLDGVYIAVCHYIRNGLSENAWVNVSHLITYNRFLRFYPDGQVLSLLANEEVSPQYIIPLLQPSLRQKGFFIGQWRLEGTTIYITSLTDPTGLTSAASRYTFEMTLELRSRPTMGRWNRLDMKAYASVKVDTGESTPVALKNDRPFWFSKVKSYG